MTRPHASPADPGIWPGEPPATPMAQLGAALALLLAGVAIDQSLPGHGAPSLFLPTSGVALALVLCSGLSLLPGIGIGMLLSGVLANQTLAHTLAQMLGTVVAAGIAGHWLREHSPFETAQPHFATLRHLLLSGCLAGAGLGSISGGTLLWLAEGGAHHGGALMHLVQAWMGQALGFLLFTPLLLGWRRALLYPLATERWREGMLLWLLVAAVSTVVFGQAHDSFLLPVANAYWMFLFVGWSAVRLGLLPTTALLCMIALHALWGTSVGSGYFANDINETWGFGYWSYMMILGVLGLALATYMADRREQKVRLRIAATAFDIHLPLLVTDARGHILQANPAFARLTGHAINELLGHAPDSLLAPGGSGNPGASWFMADDVAEQRLCLRLRDGSTVPVWGSVSPVQDGRGAISHRVITLADLTDFDAAQARQRQADRAQRDALVREVHHRIKNNLQGIIGMLHTMALHHPRLGDEIRQLGAQVQSIAIVHGLQGRQTGEEIELGELMHAVAEGVGRALNSTLNVIETTPPTLTLPTTRLARDEAVPIALVLNELMTNAIKHGDGTHVARVALSLAGGGAVITLTNPGHWNPPAVHAPSPTGRGLELVRLLLPREGARLAHTTQDGQVVTTLTLAAPVLQIAHG